MSTEQYADKKASHSSPPLQDGFESRPFATPAVPSELRSAPIATPLPLEMQLDRAERFGHSLSRVQVSAAQAKASDDAIQCQEEGEEEELAA